MRTVCIALTSAFAFAALGGTSLAARAEGPARPSGAELEQALRELLAQRGEICLARYDWPIDVSARDVAAGTRDAVQLPVMERQGLVVSEEGFVVYRTGDKEEKLPARRYRLTDLGRRSYEARETISRQPGGAVVTHHGDLCAGHLDLAEVVGVRVPAAIDGAPPTASVSYRYRFTPEPWVDHEAMRRVFPMLDRLLRGQGQLEMTQHFHFDGRAWVADSAID